jgi:type VI secretion system secreted protein Hcp
MALPFYMTLTGEKQGAIEGISTTRGHEKEVQCHALEQTIDRPINSQTGAPTGLRVHHPLTITKSFDKASPKLYQALTTGENIQEVVFHFFRITPAGQEENYFTITLKNATIICMKPSMKNVFDADLQRYDHLEDVSFTYGQIYWRWEPDSIETMDEAITDQV